MPAPETRGERATTVGVFSGAVDPREAGRRERGGLPSRPPTSPGAWPRACRSLPARRLLVSLFALSACHHLRPLRFGPGGEIRDPHVLLRALDERSARLTSIEAHGRIEIHGPRGNGSTGIEIAARRPSSLRIEIDSFFGSPVGLLATDGRDVAFLDEERGVFAAGPATPEAMARILPVAWPPARAVDLLLADPPRLSGSMTLRVDPGRAAYELAISAGGVRQLLDLDTESLALVHASLSGEEGYEADFHDLASIGGVDFPREIAVRVPAAATILRLRWREVKLDVAFSPALFRLSPPPGLRVTPMVP